MVKVGWVYFKLYRSRLAQYCLYFDKLFADETADYERRCATVEDCPVYHVPAELAADDFEKLLTVLVSRPVRGTPGTCLGTSDRTSGLISLSFIGRFLDVP